MPLYISILSDSTVYTITRIMIVLFIICNNAIWLLTGFVMLFSSVVLVQQFISSLSLVLVLGVKLVLV